MCGGRLEFARGVWRGGEFLVVVRGGGMHHSYTTNTKSLVWAGGAGGGHPGGAGGGGGLGGAAGGWGGKGGGRGGGY